MVLAICAFLTHPYSTLILGVFDPVAPDRPCWGQRAHGP